MYKISNACDTCIHNKICSIMEYYLNTQNEVNNFKSIDDPHFEIAVRCLHYQPEYKMTLRSGGPY